jgi:hypothetical protein
VCSADLVFQGNSSWIDELRVTFSLFLCELCRFMKQFSCDRSPFPDLYIGKTRMVQPQCSICPVELEVSLDGILAQCIHLRASHDV